LKKRYYFFEFARQPTLARYCHNNR